MDFHEQAIDSDIALDEFEMYVQGFRIAFYCRNEIVCCNVRQAIPQ